MKETGWGHASKLFWLHSWQAACGSFPFPPGEWGLEMGRAGLSLWNNLSNERNEKPWGCLSSQCSVPFTGLCLLGK